jgi:predicted DNA-binding transcriptional regulator AlpA
MDMTTLELLNELTVSKTLGLTRKALQNMRWRGGGPRYVKLGRRVLYDRADLEAWIQQNKRGDTSESSARATHT